MGLAGLVVGLLRFKYASDMLDPKYKGLDISIFVDWRFVNVQNHSGNIKLFVLSIQIALV